MFVMHTDEYCTEHGLICGHAQAAHDGFVAVSDRLSWKCMSPPVALTAIASRLPVCDVQLMLWIQHNILDLVGTVASCHMAQRSYHT
jgi:hypothetical protein